MTPDGIVYIILFFWENEAVFGISRDYSSLKFLYQINDLLVIKYSMRINGFQKKF